MEEDDMKNEEKRARERSNDRRERLYEERAKQQ